MTEARRLVNLPGYDDTARDIYETPELTDDASTTLTHRTSPRSPSETSDTSADSDDGDQSYGISRRRLFPERARSRFSAVQTGGNVDLSDRVDGRRRGYRVRRNRGGEDDEEEGESLEARIARLRREIEECKVEAESELDFGGRDQMAVSELEGLGRVLAGVEGSGHLQVRRRKGGVGNGAAVAAAASGGGGGGGGGEGRIVAPGAWPDGDGDTSDEQILGRVADFDSRLAALEQTLGISALDAAALDSASTATTMPVLPSLTLLDQQVATLVSAGSLASLETASARIQKLRAEADHLSQHQAKSQSRPTTSGSDSEPSGQNPPSLSQQDMTKLHSLYQLLPSLQSLSPTVPALLARLHSLRTLHTNAASAASELDEVEKRQREMDVELKAWRDGVQKVEAAVAEARETNGSNGKVVEKWVMELEGRVKGLGR